MARTKASPDTMRQKVRNAQNMLYVVRVQREVYHDALDAALEELKNAGKTEIVKAIQAGIARALATVPATSADAGGGAGQLALPEEGPQRGAQGEARPDSEGQNPAEEGGTAR